MTNSRKGNKGDSGRMAGGFVAMPWVVLDSAAYAALSHPARNLLMELARQYVRDNNGRLLMSSAYLSKRGWKSRDVISRAKQELLSAGFIHETVIGCRPNKASWYAVTWLALDKLKGYDAGTAETFRRGAFMDGAALKPKMTREDIYKKWDGAGKNHVSENASLNPSDGTEKASIVPSGGLEANPLVPSGGLISTVSPPLSSPSGGHHLEKPSATAVSSAAGPEQEPTAQITVERESSLDPSTFNPDLGEFVQQPPKPAQHQKRAADAWVASALQSRGIQCA